MQKHNNNNSSKPVKKSGCKVTTYIPKTGPNKGLEMMIFTAWRIANGDLQKIKATTTTKSFKGSHDNGYAGSIAVEIINTNTASKEFYWGVLDMEKGKVRIPDLNWVLNPKAPNGGYCGKSGKPKK